MLRTLPCSRCVCTSHPPRPCKKPLSPSCSVQMADTKDSPAPIPLLAAALGSDSRSVLLAYGNHLQPVMEKVVSATGGRKISVFSGLFLMTRKLSKSEELRTIKTLDLALWFVIIKVIFWCCSHFANSLWFTASLLISVSTGHQHSGEARLFDSGCPDQLVSLHGNHRFQGNTSYLSSGE